MTRTGLWLCLIVMFPLCTEASLETTLKYGTTQSWRKEPMLEWNGSYDTLNKYDNEADTTDCLGGYLCYVERTAGTVDGNWITVKVESSLQKHMRVKMGCASLSSMYVWTSSLTQLPHSAHIISVWMWSISYKLLSVLISYLLYMIWHSNNTLLKLQTSVICPLL